MVREVVKRPILTEKATLLAEKGVYTFEVLHDANKIEIAQSVRNRFGVEVAKVQTSWLPAKRKSQQTRKGLMQGQKAAIKKATVHLKKGFTIDLFAPLDAKESGSL
ncbi:MAG: 50S ribosomal protein L23 [Candidatus Kapaibacterium sp.]